jgi:(E)-4-hydroxy-3-methylbut-2-enyl-diphosphate synthase
MHRLADAGCELIRITAQGEREAKNLAQIKKELANKGYTTSPDRRYTLPPQGSRSRCLHRGEGQDQPGNYTDRNTPGKDSFTVKEYELELERIAERIDPLLTIWQTTRNSHPHRFPTTVR